MKTLILMRHAKSSWDAGQIADHDRILSDRGREAAPAMGQWLKSQKLKPDLVLCSTAARVSDTLALLQPSLPAGTPVKALEALYMALPREILTVLAKVKEKDKVETLMVIGHNPGIGSLAHWLSGQGDKKALERMRDKFPTAGIAVIDFDIATWKELDGEQGTLRQFMTPKDLPKT
jgi:phosphohistidine phosphatase